MRVPGKGVFTKCARELDDRLVLTVGTLHPFARARAPFNPEPADIGLQMRGEHRTVLVERVGGQGDAGDLVERVQPAWRRGADMLRRAMGKKIKAEMETMSPAAREKRRMEVELERERRRIQEEEERAHAEAEKKAEEENRKRLEDEKKAEYDELLAYAVEFVESNPKVVSGIFKEWLANDAAKTNEANVAASGAA